MDSEVYAVASLSNELVSYSPQGSSEKVRELETLVTRSRGDRGGPIAVLIPHDLLRVLRASA
jgi:hypothetical protein